MKGVTIALLVSLAANIALISFMGGRLAGGAPPRPDPPGGPARLFERATPEVRALLRGAFEDRFDDARPARRAAAEKRLALRDAILTEPFDRARVEAAYAAFRSAEEDIQKIHGAVVIDVLAKLPLEDRRTLIAALAAPDRGPPRPHRRGGRDENRAEGPAKPPPPDGPGN